MSTKTKPLVSVCVVAYNQEKYIRQSLLSIINQETNFEFEIIVSDDFSNDKTASIIYEIAQEYPGKVKAIFHEINIGAFENYITTHNAASGDYIAHLDGDDNWLPGKLSKQLNFLETNPQCSAVYTNAIVIDKNGNKIGIFNKKLPSIFDRSFLLKKGNFLNASSLFYRRSLIKKILPSSSEFIDYQIHLNCSQFGKSGYINEPLVSYRVHADGMASKSSLKVLKLYWVALEDVFKIDGATPAMKSAVTDFMGIVFCRAIIEKDLSTVKKWINIIHAETKISKNYIITVGLLKSVAKIANSVKKRVLRGLNMPIIFASR